jgi:ADP-ribose pyrophosphatase YjhB (NUDIX family)
LSGFRDTERPGRAVADHVAGLDAALGSARDGLPQEVFYLVSRLTPLVNVDLLIRNDSGATLLTWRQDEFYGAGWHIPGGIVRFKETFAERIAAVAWNELGCAVEHDAAPAELREIMAPHRDVRGHFISLLFNCRLSSQPSELLKYSGGMPLNGQWQWHDRCPPDLIAVHEIYRPCIDGRMPDRPIDH